MTFQITLLPKLSQSFSGHMSSTGLRTEVPLAKVTILPCSILTQSRLSDALFIKSKISSLLNPAQDSDTARPVGRMFLSFPRACLARARNPEFCWRTAGKDRDSSRGSHARE